MSGPLLTGVCNGASLASGTEARRGALLASLETRASASAQVAFASAVPTTVPSLIILGTDAVLAAAPATPVQLAQACLSAGYHVAIPGSWGDELIAARAIERLRDADGPLVQCSCPYVSRRLANHGETLAPMLLSFVPPPVATAQYLRAVYAPARPRITYAGGCPSAAHDSIDVWLSPDELMNALAEQGISATAQPTEFDSVLPPDRRRYYSDPGGVPSRHALRHLPTPVDVVELKGRDIVLDLAQQLLSGSRALIDVALPLGCCCSGAVGTSNLEAARGRVRELEPPRALGPVVDHSVRFPLEGIPPGAETIVVKEPTPPAPLPVPRTTRPAEPVSDPTPVAIEVAPRRRSPPGLSRPVLGTMPIARSDAGRQLPRAYIARRRSSPRGFRESFVKSEPSSAPSFDHRRRFLVAAATGVLVGLAIAWALFAIF